MKSKHIKKKIKTPKISVLKCTDIFGTTVEFTKNNYDKHRLKHRELENPSFCPARIEKALKTPTLTIKSQIPHALCYYYEEYRNNDIMMYTKVIVDERHRYRKRNPICHIKTAFRIDHIQELKYNYKPNHH